MKTSSSLFDDADENDDALAPPHRSTSGGVRRHDLTAHSLQQDALDLAARDTAYRFSSANTKAPHV
jgi:hypothetical protein